MKFSDDFYDVYGNLKIATVFGVLCAVCSAFASVFDVGAAYIFISILIGNILALKVDGIHHFVTLVLFVLVLLIFGCPLLDISILIIGICAALFDEIGHELIPNLTNNSFLLFFFEYRFVMKVVILLMAISGVFSFWTFILFIIFELSYVMADMFVNG